MDKAMTKENLTKALDSLNFTRSDLLGALAHCDPVEALVIQDLLEQLMPALNKTQQLLSAMEAKE